MQKFSLGVSNARRSVWKIKRCHINTVIRANVFKTFVALESGCRISQTKRENIKLIESIVNYNRSV